MEMFASPQRRRDVPLQSVVQHEVEETVTAHETVMEESDEEDEYQLVGFQEESILPIDPDDVWSSLEEALGEMGYDVYQTAVMLKSGKLPTALVDLVSRKLSSSAERVRPMLETQCPLLLPGVLSLIKTIECQLELQRQAQEKIRKADAAEKVLLIAKEKKRQAEAIMERVKMIGRCCAGYEWLKVDGGYRCAGGSHFVSDSMVNTL